MAKRIELTAKDGHKLDALRAEARGNVKGSVVVIHFVFGLTDLIGETCDDLAAQGYDVVAPSLYDRVGKNLVFEYSDESALTGLQTYLKIRDHEEEILADIDAGVAAVRTPGRRIATYGFCLGGTWAWVTAAQLAIDASVVVYGTNIPAQYLHHAPRVPTQIHNGDVDHVAPMSDMEKIKQTYPAVEMNIYPGCAHSFCNPFMKSYKPKEAMLVRDRALAFLDKHIAAK